MKWKSFLLKKCTKSDDLHFYRSLNIYKIKLIKKDDEQMELTKENLFFCYDLALQRKLKEKGIRYVFTGLTNSLKRTWIYFRTDEVNEIIKQHVKQ